MIASIALNENYFETFHLGMPGQIRQLSLDDMVLYALNHIHSFLMDEAISFCFIERFANDPETPRNKQASNALRYFLDKALQLRPLRPGLLDAVVKLTNDQQMKQRLAIIEGLNQSKETYDLISALNIRTDGEDARTFIAQLLETYPNHVAAAQFALGVDRFFGEKPGPWLARFKCPKALKGVWDIAVFNHYAGICAYEEAMALWPTLNTDLLQDVAYNRAAEMFIAAGDEKQGLELYAKSLEIDPRQTPVKLRIRELKNPFKPNESLLDTCSVNILLYSWNKADMLDQTLKSLSQSDIGSAPIDILLNGCTDHSLEVVENARALFPNNRITLHNLHVNIGAPGARNWLMNLPEVKKSKYLAFLDDDVTVQKDWLAAFLTVAESDEKIGVVGAKVVHPGQPAMYQYLYRYIAMADNGLLKMSIDNPNSQYDNHLYDVIRECRNVMGCQHLLRTSAQENIPRGFDIQFSPSQVDDIDHDIAICLEGYKVMYCGYVTCVHHQSSGTNYTKVEFDLSKTGGIMGNDLKLYYKHCNHLDKLKALDNLSLDLGVDLPEF